MRAVKAPDGYHRTGAFILKVSRAAYYEWIKAIPNKRIAENMDIADKAAVIHEKHPDMEIGRASCRERV